jgi:hypothetical protein
MAVLSGFRLERGWPEVDTESALNSFGKALYAACRLPHARRNSRGQDLAYFRTDGFERAGASNEDTHL